MEGVKGVQTQCDMKVVVVHKGRLSIYLMAEVMNATRSAFIKPKLSHSRRRAHRRHILINKQRASFCENIESFTCVQYASSVSFYIGG